MLPSDESLASFTIVPDLPHAGGKKAAQSCKSLRILITGNIMVHYVTKLCYSYKTSDRPALAEGQLSLKYME